MSRGCIDIQIGATYSNDLAPKFVEHRKVTGMENGFVQYAIVSGKRTGSTGAATRIAFWKWKRVLVIEVGDGQSNGVRKTAEGSPEGTNGGEYQ